MSAAGNGDNNDNGDTHARLTIYDDLETLARAAADLLVRLQQDVRPQEHYNIALSGGSTPRTFHSMMVSPPWRDQIGW